MSFENDIFNRVQTKLAMLLKSAEGEADVLKAMADPNKTVSANFPPQPAGTGYQMPSLSDVLGIPSDIGYLRGPTLLTGVQQSINENMANLQSQGYRFPESIGPAKPQPKQPAKKEPAKKEAPQVASKPKPKPKDKRPG